MTPRLLVLVILDGWGIGPVYEGNAISRARTPNMDRLFQTCPHAQLKCWGEAVGLPEGQMGNSEVGHLNLGAGRIVYQDITRIDRAIRDGSFFEHPGLLRLIRECRDKGTALHLMGLVSDGGVHSHLNHLLAILRLARREGLEKVMVQAITDGRDTPPKQGIEFIAQLQQQMGEIGVGRIAAISGRFYAMDRDNRWDRVEKAFRVFTRGEGDLFSDPVNAVKEAYQRGETDEFITPCLIKGEKESPIGLIQAEDALFFFNFRADRAREITRAFREPGFSPFPVVDRPNLSAFMTMTEYDATFSEWVRVAFPPQNLAHTLGETVSRQGISQLRIAETEKYAHVTYFFSGGKETPFPLEDRCLIPSSREVPTYDLKPAMSAREVTREVVDRIRSRKYGLIVLNFANLDMVGHTGKLPAAIEACEVVDACLGDVLSTVSEEKGTALVTADHGNAEEMIDRIHGGPHTAHTSANPVPVVLVDGGRPGVRLNNGILADVAPTILTLMDLPIPEEMTGRCLMVGD
ncbi:MAG: 2,3-bisphosphoglycerate-independent phosphoglycerate mutase [Thermodesulfobacteriota bacterium]